MHHILVQNNRAGVVSGEQGSARCLGEVKQKLCMDSVKIKKGLVFCNLIVCVGCQDTPGVQETFALPL